MTIRGTKGDQEVDYCYDTNPIDANYSAQAWGRMTAVKFANGYNTATASRAGSSSGSCGCRIR